MADIPALADRITKLSTADKLTLALSLVTLGKLEAAESITKAALDDLTAARLFGKAKLRP